MVLGSGPGLDFPGFLLRGQVGGPVGESGPQGTTYGTDVPGWAFLLSLQGAVYRLHVPPLIFSFYIYFISMCNGVSPVCMSV